jgi:uncharacterized delta-60 repeat protein
MKASQLRTVFSTILLLCLNLAARPTPVAAQPGYPDATFGTAGVAAVSLDPAFSPGSADVAIQSDGRIVVVGSWVEVLDFPFLVVIHGVAVARFLPDGTPDASFGNMGVVVLLESVHDSLPGGVLVQPADGKIVVLATVGTNSAHDFALERLLPDGTPDSTFGSGGIVFDDLGADDNAVDMTLDSGGNIVVSGATGAGGPPYLLYDTVLARYRPDGTLDATFGSGGHVVEDLGGGLRDEASAVAIQGDGTIVIAGRVFFDNANATGFLVARFLDDGTLDTAFGSSGSVTTTFNESSGGGELALQADGKLVVSGYQGAAGHPNIAVLRYLASGTLDPAFGDGGKVTIEQLTGYSFPSGLALQADGRIVIAGSDAQHGVLARLLPDGSRDGSFGSACGVFVTDLAAALAGLVIQQDGNLVTALGDQLGAARFLGGSEGSTFCSVEPCAPATKQKLTVSKLLAPSGDERLTLKGEATLPSTLGLDPAANGVHVVVEDADDAAVLDTTISGGPYDPVSRIGWKIGAGGTSWTYRNPGSHPQGIRMVGVKIPRSAPLLVKFKVKGQNGSYPVGTLPLRATLVLAPPVERCIAATWLATPPLSPSCQSSNVATVRCK